MYTYTCGTQSMAKAQNQRLVINSISVLNISCLSSFNYYHTMEMHVLDYILYALQCTYRFLAKIRLPLIIINISYGKTKQKLWELHVWTGSQVEGEINKKQTN